MTTSLDVGKYHIQNGRLAAILKFLTLLLNPSITHELVATKIKFGGNLEWRLEYIFDIKYLTSDWNFDLKVK